MFDKLLDLRFLANSANDETLERFEVLKIWYFGYQRGFQLKIFGKSLKTIPSIEHLSVERLSAGPGMAGFTRKKLEVLFQTKNA